jgi:hypothetical protein
MAAYNKFNAFVADVMNKVHNLGSDTLKLLLSNVTPVATNAVKADLTEITAQNGYSAGGGAVSVTLSVQYGGTYGLQATQVVFTASGGSFGPFEFVCLYNSTPGAGNLISWWDYGSAVTLNNGETFTVKFNSTSPGTVFTCA